MSMKQVIIVTSLIAVCVCVGTQKKSCFRPDLFKSVGELTDYVKCLKSNTGSPPYGKRSVQPPSIFLQKLNPLIQDYDPEYLEQLVYAILKAERNLRNFHE